MDPRIKKLAKTLVNYSCRVQKGEKVLIDCVGDSAIPLVRAVIYEVYENRGMPFVDLKDYSVTREILKESSIEQLKSLAKYEITRMREMAAFIGIRASDNISELSDIAPGKMADYMKYFMEAVNNIRINNTKWVVLRYPNESMAQLANTSTEAFEDFYFNVCNMDYGKMSKAMDSLVKLMNKTDRVHITGKDTDLSFSIKDIPAIKCDGEFNIPDGEVFTAPVKSSVNGKLAFNSPAVFQGVTYENIKLEFKDGKIIEASSNDTERINKVLDTDRGARYIGEFSLGVNPFIIQPMKDTLFDEKIMGSFHFTPGKCYREASNGNDSAIHWDLISIQTPEYGGGEIYFDSVLIRKNGRFVIRELEGLNPENLK
ncbi:MAG: aminopeptidase [Actinomycetota bacterium]|nr:aminopeptidase [Actinomycetota bacterium]